MAEAGGDLIHVDVMDGHFVPNLTIGPPVVARPLAHGDAAARRAPHDRAPRALPRGFPDAGADWISVHVEACAHLHRALMPIREPGGGRAWRSTRRRPSRRSSVRRALRPGLVMSVNPGFGGQPFIATSVEKVERLRALLPDRVAIEVNGGISAGTLPSVRDAGAELFVSASTIFGVTPVAAYAELARRCRRGEYRRRTIKLLQGGVHTPHRRSQPASPLGGRPGETPEPTVIVRRREARGDASASAALGTGTGTHRGRRTVHRRGVRAGRDAAAAHPPQPAGRRRPARDGEVVGRGWHHGPGEPHAEAMALARGRRARPRRDPLLHARALLPPRPTPPCADALVAAGVARVVIALRDPDPRRGRPRARRCCATPGSTVELPGEPWAAGPAS